MNGTGLLPQVKDERDLKLGGVFDQPFLADLPEEYVIEGWKIKDQKNSDFCSAFAFCGLSELQEGTELSPEFSFALSKLLSGDVESWGQSLADAARVHVKYGGLEKSLAPFSLENKDASFLRKIENWGDTSGLLNRALEHSKEGYYKTSGRYKGAENIMTWLYKFRNERRAVATGVLWGWDNSNPIIETVPTNGDGHAIALIGWKKINGKTYIILANSWGVNVGDKGFFYVAPEVIDHFVDTYGGLMFKDITPERARFLQENGLKADGSKIWELIIPMWKKVIDLLGELAAALFITHYNEKVEPEVPPELPVKTASEYLLEAALECEGKDIGKTQDALACAESLNYVHKLAFGAEIGGTTSTYRLYQALRIDPTFKKVTQPTRGDIIISPTGYAKAGGKIPNGHCGIVVENSAIMSNNSKSFKWEKNFTLYTWDYRYVKQGLFPVYFFRKIV